jgi:hypothetical protein
MHDIERLLEAAEQHGRDEGYEVWVGDLEQLLRAAWAQLSDAQREAALASPEGADALGSWAMYLEEGQS